MRARAFMLYAFNGKGGSIPVSNYLYPTDVRKTTESSTKLLLKKKKGRIQKYIQTFENRPFGRRIPESGFTDTKKKTFFTNTSDTFIQRRTYRAWVQV